MDEVKKERSIIFFGSDDLFFRAKIEQILAARGFNLTFVRFADELIPTLTREGSGTVIIDLDRCEPKMQEISQIVMKSGYRSIGFYPHAKRHLAHQAKKTGISQVIPRSGLETALQWMLN